MTEADQFSQQTPIPAQPSEVGSSVGSNVGTNWAGNLRYSAGRLLQPSHIEELSHRVAASARIKPVGSRHSFNTIADTPGDLLDLSGLPWVFDLDEAAQTVTVDAGMRYGQLAAELQARGWALENMASLPHITVVGSVATGTHGSGDRNAPLSAAVSAVDMVLADGSLHRFTRDDPEFGGVVVNLGAVGVVTQVTLDIVPSFEARQDVYDGLSWQGVLESFDDLTGSAYSVSLFTRWSGEQFGYAWLKTARASSAPANHAEPPAQILGAPTLGHDVGLVEGAKEATTAQSGRWGSWDQRLPHFKLDFTPSNGTELQSEYLLPRENAVEAVQRLRKLGPRLAPHLLLGEVRTMAAEDQWMSCAYGRDTVGFHFTWRQHIEEVTALLLLVEDQLLPLGARPHWGKLFAITDLEPLYPRFGDFRALAEKHDPTGKFRNDYLDRLVFG